MKKELIEKYVKEKKEYCIYKINFSESVEFQAYLNNKPIGVKITASYTDIFNYKYYGLVNLESEFCKIIKSDIDKGLLIKTT